MVGFLVFSAAINQPPLPAARPPSAALRRRLQAAAAAARPVATLVFNVRVPLDLDVLGDPVTGPDAAPTLVGAPDVRW